MDAQDRVQMLALTLVGLLAVGLSVVFTVLLGHQILTVLLAAAAGIAGLLVILAVLWIARVLRRRRERAQEESARQRVADLQLAEVEDFSDALGFETVFDHFDERWLDRVEAIQETSLRTPGGLAIAHGPFGSEEWLAAKRRRTPNSTSPRSSSA